MASLVVSLAGQDFTFKVLDADFDITTLNLPPKKVVNIVASGTSIKQVDFTDVARQPCMFVNGSIALTHQYAFSQMAGYVITDPRFIRHNLAILQNCYYSQCPLFITQSVLQALMKKYPEFLIKFCALIYLIFAVDRPITGIKKQGFLRKIFAKKPSLSDFEQNPYYVIKNDIGVSLDIRHGFVEAGTVAFVATQLAFSMGFTEIRLFGVDLINANEPRFYENIQDTAPSKLAPAIYNRIVPSFDLLAKTYAKYGVTLVNTSPISKDLFQNLPFKPI